MSRIDELIGELRVALELIEEMESKDGYFYERRHEIVARIRRKVNEAHPDMSTIVAQIDTLEKENS